jgi:hypothetical protein
MPKIKKDVAPERAPIFVKVARLGGEVHEYALNGARTVEAALEAAELVSDDDDRIRVNGEPAVLETELQNGDVLTVAGRIEGAR